MKKICIKCNTEKDIDNFSFRNDTGKYRNECKECIKEKQATYYKNNIDILTENNNKRYNIYKKNSKDNNSINYLINNNGLVELKKCTRCGTEKPETSEYFIFKKIYNIYSSICKDCDKFIHKEWVEDNKEIHKLNTSERYDKEHPGARLKICNICFIEKPEFSDFYHFDKIINKYKNICKECEAKNNKEWVVNNQEYVNNKQKEWRNNNKDYIRETHAEYSKIRRETDPIFVLRNNVSRSINRMLKSNNSSKNGYSILEYLPYTIDQLKQHLESLFDPWMNWSNWGPYNSKTWVNNDQSTWTWQIDHVVPHSMFKYESMENNDFKLCWALDNLRPYSAKQNLLDGAKRIRHKKGIK